MGAFLYSFRHGSFLRLNCTAGNFKMTGVILKACLRCAPSHQAPSTGHSPPPSSPSHSRSSHRRPSHRRPSHRRLTPSYCCNESQICRWKRFQRDFSHAPFAPCHNQRRRTGRRMRHSNRQSGVEQIRPCKHGHARTGRTCRP